MNKYKHIDLYIVYINIYLVAYTNRYIYIYLNIFEENTYTNIRIDTNICVYIYI